MTVPRAVGSTRTWPSSGTSPRAPPGLRGVPAHGHPWVHLRLCLTCGHVGCCDSSPSGTPAGTPVWSATRSSARSSRARTGGGATSTRRTHDAGVRRPPMSTSCWHGATRRDPRPVRGVPPAARNGSRCWRLWVAAADPRGEVLIAEGHPEDTFYVVLSGRVAVVEAFGTPEQRVVRVHGPGRFLGELGMLTGQLAFFTAIVLDPGEVLAVPPTGYASDRRGPAFGDQVLRAYLSGAGWPSARGRIPDRRLAYSAATRRLREFAARNRLPHRFVDLETDAAAERCSAASDSHPRHAGGALPGPAAAQPRPAELAALFGLRVAGHRGEAVRPGGGRRRSGGTGRRGLRRFGGADTGSSTPLRPVARRRGRRGSRTTSASRRDLRWRTGRAGGAAGREVRGPTVRACRAVALDTGRAPRAAVRGGDSDHAHLIVATGVRSAGCPCPAGEFEQHLRLLRGHAGRGPAVRGDPVVVVGGGNSAGQAAAVPRRPRRRGPLVVRESRLDEYMSRYLADRITHDPRIEVHLHTVVRSWSASVAAGGGRRRGHATDERQRCRARPHGVHRRGPEHRWLSASVALDSGGYVLTGRTRAAAGGDAPIDAQPTPLARDEPARACSRRAMCAADRSSGWRPRSVKGRWRSAWCTSTWRRCGSGR